MTPEEQEIGTKWMGILNAYSTDFSTKSLFNQTANYLKTLGKQKRTSRFQKEVKQGTILTENVKAPEKKYSLLEAAQIRANQEVDDYEEIDIASNLLAISETSEYSETKTKRSRKND